MMSNTQEYVFKCKLLIQMIKIGKSIRDILVNFSEKALMEDSLLFVKKMFMFLFLACKMYKKH